MESLENHHLKMVFLIDESAIMVCEKMFDLFFIPATLGPWINFPVASTSPFCRSHSDVGGRTGRRHAPQPAAFFYKYR